MQQADRIYIAGHRGMVGSAIMRRLRSEGFTNLITRTSAEADLRDQSVVDHLFREESPEYVFLAAARVGGILANDTYRAQFLYDNLMIQANVIDAAHRHGIRKLLFLGSSCIYPRDAPQPIKESYLLTGKLEPSNEPYSIAKIAGIKLCEAYRSQHNANFISVMPTNLYGPNDNYNPQDSHVLAALIRKFYEAIRDDSNVVIWGSGNVKREFLHADDAASACIFLMQRYNGAEPVNIGYGKDISIAELAGMMKKLFGFNGQLIFDHTKPEGTPRKLLDSSRLQALGWNPAITLRDGLLETFRSFATESKLSTLYS